MNNDRKVLLIFGASGFVGPYLAREFSSYGYEVYVTDVSHNTNMPDFGLFMECDILDEALVRSLIHEVKPTHIINLAALSNVGLSWKYPQKAVSINVIGSLNIIEAMREIKNPPRLLLVGSSEEYFASNEPIAETWDLHATNPYGLTKDIQGKFVHIYREKYGLKIFYVRSFNHTGVGQNENFVIPSWCKQVASITKSGKQGVLKVGNLEVKRDFSDVRDIVRAYRLVIESGNDNEVYNIGSGTVYSLKELLEYIVSLSNQEITIEIEADRMRGLENDIICCDNSKIKKQLSWEPEYDIKETVLEMFEHYLQEWS